MPILLLCCTVGLPAGFAGNDGDDNVPSMAQQALIVAYENEARVGLVDRALFHQRFVLNKEEVVVKFGWDGERQFQRIGDREHRVYDGISAASFRVNGSQPRLTIRNNAHDVLHGWPEWNLNDMFPLTQHWWARETESKPPPRFEPLGSQMIDGVQCFVYAGIGSTFDNRPQVKRVCVDSSGLVRQLEEYLGSFAPNTPPTQALEKAALYRRIKYTEHHQYGHVNVPTILEVEGVGEYVSRTIRTELVEFQPEFRANDFALDIPHGTEVYDSTREPPESYTYPMQQMSEAALQERRAAIERELAEQRQIEQAQLALIGQVAPELTIDKWLNADISPITIRGLKGKWVLLDFTSIACGPCLNAIPLLNEALEEFNDKPIQVVSVHTHVTQENYRDIQQYMREHDIRYAIGVSSEDSNHAWGKVFRAYNVRSIPYAALIDPNGQIVSLEAVWEALARLRKEF